MSKFIKNMSLFFACLPLASARAADVVMDNSTDRVPPSDLNPVDLRAVNDGLNNLFAGHRSHSSHSSHSSHYSGAGGGGSYKAPRAPVAPPTYTTPPASGQSLQAPAKQPTDPGRPAQVSPTPTQQAAPQLSLEEKRKLQIMRVQIALTSLGLYDKSISGLLDANTKDAIKLFQSLKGMPETGLMTTETLDGLGVMAVQ